MRLKISWMEFIDFAVEGIQNRGYDVKSIPMFMWKPGTYTPEAVEIEINKRKLPYDPISSF